MSEKRETLFTRRALQDLRTLPNSFWEKIQQVSRRGTPDIIGTLNGATVVLELKSSQKARVAPLQWHMLQCWSDGGALAVLAYPENWENTFKYLKSLSDRSLSASVSVNKQPLRLDQH